MYPNVQRQQTVFAGLPFGSPGNISGSVPPPRFGMRKG